MSVGESTQRCLLPLYVDIHPCIINSSSGIPVFLQLMPCVFLLSTCQHNKHLLQLDTQNPSSRYSRLYCEPIPFSSGGLKNPLSRIARIARIVASACLPVTSSRGIFACVRQGFGRSCFNPWMSGCVRAGTEYLPRILGSGGQTTWNSAELVRPAVPSQSGGRAAQGTD